MKLVNLFMKVESICKERTNTNISGHSVNADGKTNAYIYGVLAWMVGRISLVEGLSTVVSVDYTVER